MECYYETEYIKKSSPIINKAKSTDKIVFKNLPMRGVSSIRDYLNVEPLGCIDNFKILEYWLNMKNSPLKQFALDVITIPGTNASIERMFSVCSLVEDKKRLKMKSEIKCQIVCLHSWLNCEFLEEY